MRNDQNADWSKNGTGTLKEKVSEIIEGNHYAPIADAINNNEYVELSDFAKIDADNVLEEEENSKKEDT